MIEALLAWRESRGSRLRLLFLSCNIALGVAFLSAFASFATNMRTALSSQSRALFGADFMLSSRSEFGSVERALFQEVGGRHSEEISFTTMARTLSGERARLSQLRAVDELFPLYGKLETEPSIALARFHAGAGALLEETLLLQLGLKVGEKLKIGERAFEVLGVIKQIPSSNPIWASIAPAVLVPLSQVHETNLISFGSRVNYKEYFQVSREASDIFLETNRKRIDALHLNIETSKEKEKNFERNLEL